MIGFYMISLIVFVYFTTSVYFVFLWLILHPVVALTKFWIHRMYSNVHTSSCLFVCLNVCTYWLFTFLGTFQSWWNTSHSMSLLMVMKHLYYHWFDLHEIRYLWVEVNFVDPFQFWSEFKENNRYFAWKPTHIFTYILSFQWIYLITFPSKFAVT